MRHGGPVHERDVADVAVAALSQEGHQAKAYDQSGPEPITRREQVEAIATAIGRPVRLEVVTPEQAREHYRRQGGFAAANASCPASPTTKAGRNRPHRPSTWTV
jgi:uncharacterized protein YbjT (DUF2867 family)